MMYILVQTNFNLGLFKIKTLARNFVFLCFVVAPKNNLTWAYDPDLSEVCISINCKAKQTSKSRNDFHACE